MFFPILRYPSIIVFLPLEACLSDACYMYVIGFEITFQAVKFTFYTSEICHDIYVMVVLVSLLHFLLTVGCLWVGFLHWSLLWADMLFDAWLLWLLVWLMVIQVSKVRNLSA